MDEKEAEARPIMGTIFLVYLLCMIKVGIGWCTCRSVENVITLGKLIGLLFLFCLPLLSILFLITKRNDLARPVMGTIFLVGRAKRAPHWGVQSRFRVIYVCRYVSYV